MVIQHYYLSSLTFYTNISTVNNLKFKLLITNAFFHSFYGVFSKPPTYVMFFAVLALFRQKVLCTKNVVFIVIFNAFNFQSSI
jgi:hypothetical protein